MVRRLMREDEVYDQVNAAWREAGLADRRVIDTPGWQYAVSKVREYCATRGWFVSPMGPVDRDTWCHWLHILSHSLEDGHNLTHANCELELAELAIAALRDASSGSA